MFQRLFHQSIHIYVLFGDVLYHICSEHLLRLPRSTNLLFLTHSLTPLDHQLALPIAYLLIPSSLSVYNLLIIISYFCLVCIRQFNPFPKPIRPMFDLSVYGCVVVFIVSPWLSVLHCQCCGLPFGFIESIFGMLSLALLFCVKLSQKVLRFARFSISFQLFLHHSFHHRPFSHFFFSQLSNLMIFYPIFFCRHSNVCTCSYF